MSDQSQGAGWWQASDGKWHPPEQASGLLQPPQIPQDPHGQPAPGWVQASDGRRYPPQHAPRTHSQIPGAPQRAKTDEESVATQQRRASHADAAGATLIVAGIVGGIAWAWEFVRTQFVLDEPDSLGARLDLLADHSPLLLLSGVAAGLGLGLRTLAATQTGSAARSVLCRPVGRMLLVVATALVVFLGGTAIVADDDDGTSNLGALYEAPPSVDVLVPVAPPTMTTSDEPPDPTHTLEVHSDGCGLFRSGEIGDDLTWVIKDQDGFQVLSRNAAGETQYRYYRLGTYTVALEAWGGGYYVDVSNEVTITC